MSTRSFVPDVDPRLLAVVVASGEAIICYGRDATILAWNPAAESMFGYAPEEAIGQPLSIILPPERADETEELFARLRNGETVKGLETVRVRKDGARIPVRLNLAPIGNPAGAVSATLHDLTEIKRAEALFRGLLESAPDPILGVNRDGLIVFANAQAETVFGYARADLLEQPVELLLPDRFRELHRRQRAGYNAAPRSRAMGTGLELWARRADGTELPVEISLSPVAGGGEPFVVALVRDITDRKRADDELRERERKFHAIFNATFQFIGLTTPEGVLLEANQSALDFAGVDERDVVGKPFWETPWWTHSSELQTRVRLAIESAARGEFVRFEATHRRPDGTLAAVDFSLKPVRDEAGKVVLLVPEGRDVTDRKRAEVEREKLLAIAQEGRMKAEESLRIRAEAERLKDDLTSMIVHDLKNPVSGIIMMVQSALRRREEMSARQRDTLLQIDCTCREMLRLIQNILDISKMEDGKMPIAREAFVVAEIVDGAVRDLVPLAEQAGRSLEVVTAGALPIVAADRALLRRVLVNLIVNALRHSGSRVVSVETAATGDAEVVIRVIDHGRGIPEEERGRIFEKFTSVHRTPSSEPRMDTGLGLPFCKLAMEQMGGRLELTSEPGVITVFAVALPVHGSADQRIVRFPDTTRSE